MRGGVKRIINVCIPLLSLSDYRSKNVCICGYTCVVHVYPKCTFKIVGKKKEKKKLHRNAAISGSENFPLHLYRGDQSMTLGISGS